MNIILRVRKIPNKNFFSSVLKAGYLVMNKLHDIL